MSKWKRKKKGEYSGKRKANLTKTGEAVATIDELVVKLSVDASFFDRNIDQAERRISSFEKNSLRALKGIGNAFVSAGKFAGGLAVAAGVAGAAIVAFTAKSIDSLGKVGDKLGLGTEALTSFRLAGELTGVATNTLDQALQRMARRTAEAAIGTGEAKGALIELGLNAAELSKLGTEETFKRIADAMSKVEDKSTQLRLAFKLFDSEGVALTNTLAGGSKFLDDIAKKADLFGLSLSRVEVARVESMNDSFTMLGSLLTGIARQFTVAIAPVVTYIVNTFVDWVTKAGGVKNVVKDIAITFLEGIQKAIEGVQSFITGLGKVKQFLFDIGAIEDTAGRKRTENIALLRSEISKISGSVQTYQKAQGEQNYNAAIINELMAERVAKQKELDALLKGETDLLPQLAAGVENIINKMKTGDFDKPIIGGAKLPGFEAATPTAAPVVDEDKIKDDLESKINLLRDSFLTEETLVAENLERKMFMVEEAHFNEVVDFQESRDLIKQINDAHLLSLEEAQNNYIDAMAAKRAQDVERQQKEQTRLQQFRLSSAASFFGSMASLVGTGSKQQFETSKKLARSEAILSTGKAAIGVYADTHGDPITRALAMGSALATGAAQIANINRTSYGGGGNISAGGGGGGGGLVGGTPAPATPNIPRADDFRGGSEKVVQIQFIGSNIYGQEHFEEYLKETITKITDNDVVIFNSNSAQKEELIY